MQKNMVHGFPLLELRTMFPFIYFVLIALLLWILYSNLKSVRKRFLQNQWKKKDFIYEIWKLPFTKWYALKTRKNNVLISWSSCLSLVMQMFLNDQIKLFLYLFLADNSFCLLFF